MKRKLQLKSLLLTAALFMGTSAVYGQTTTTLMEYGTNDVAWTAEGLATWTAGGTPTFDDANNPTYVGISGGNGGYSTSKTISPTSGNIINLTAIWRGRSNTGRAFSVGNCSYFRYGNIVIAQNDQDQKHGYVFTGLDNISTSVTKFTAGSYRTDIANCTWLKIEAEINTATNTLTSFSIKSEDGATTYVSESNIALTSPDYTTVAFGYQKKGSVSNTNAEQLKSIKITETTQSVSYANYTVHFKDNNGATVKEDEIRNGEVGSTVNANTNDKTTFTSGDYKYVYSSDGGGVVITSGGTAELTITYNKIGKYTYNVIAVDENTNPLGTIATSTVYTDETASVIWSKYVTVSDQWYVTSETTFKATATEAGSRNVVYNVSDIAYFYEMEKLTRSGGAYLTEESESYSGGSRLRLSRGSMYYTPALSAGIYKLSIPWANTNGSASEVYVYTRTSEGVLSDILETFTATGSSSGTFTYTITVPEGYSIAFKGNEGGSANNNARMDYMALNRVVPVTIPTGTEPTGYATIASAYPLDCSGVTAYKVTSMTASQVTAVEVTEAVAAGTGLIISGTPGQTYYIPVAATGTDISATNLLQAAVTATAVDANTAYGLKDGKFVKLNAGNVPAGKAYLLATSIQAPELGIDFGNGTTGIENVNRETITNNRYFNLAGQRIAQPTKGLYIVNGRKVVFK